MRDLAPAGDGALPALSGARRVLRDLALFLPHFVLLLKRLIGDPRVPRRSKLVLGGTLLYLLSPLDIVPDFVPGLGQVDDVVVVLLALHSLLNRVDESVVLEHWEGSQDLIRAVRSGLAAISQLLPGELERRV
jgi:uncharacterized membrane protein YkvA (DUF1232 family)